MNLFETGIRPAVDAYLLKKSQEERDYGSYWSASAAGYCMRKQIFERLKVPRVKDDARKTRVFESGHIFHEWMQRITKDAGLSIAQELELQDEGLMVRGHFDDLVLVEGKLILIDYKTQSSRAFSYQKDRPMSYYHKMQVGTYMYMLRQDQPVNHNHLTVEVRDGRPVKQYFDVLEARILKISKDDLRMSEQQLLWSDELKQEVENYWIALNGYWGAKIIPPCTCADHEGGFLAKEAYNDFFYEGEPCSITWASGKVDLSKWSVKE